MTMASLLEAAGEEREINDTLIDRKQSTHSIKGPLFAKKIFSFCPTELSTSNMLYRHAPELAHGAGVKT